MLDVSATHPLEAAAAFAVRLLRTLATGDAAGVTAVIDVNDTGRPLGESFPRADGFTYCHPDRVRGWSLRILGADERGLRLDFDLPFADEEYQDRPMVARYHLRRVGAHLEVRLTGVVPS
jgi:hypothetical protein